MRVLTDSRQPPAATTGASASVNDPARPLPGIATGRLVVGAAAGAAVVFAVSLLLSRRTAMWLDEAQTLSIARLPLADLLDALRTDGSPPLYYVLLHGWTELFGASDVAARSLSAVLAVGAVAVVPLAGLRVGGRRMAIAAAGLLATVPFMHRYATEARMYTLVVLLTVAGFVAVHAALHRPSRGAHAGVAAVTALLLLTHYWAFFLLATTAAVVAGAACRQARGAPSRRAHAGVLVAMALGVAPFLAWAPAFVHQLRHTGAPWGPAAGPWIYESSLRGFVGDGASVGLLGFVYAGLAVLGLFGRPLAHGRLELDFAGRPPARPLGLVAAGTLAAAMVVSQLTGSAFAPRYAAVVLLPFVLLAARGLAIVEHRRVLTALAVVVAGLGVVRSFQGTAAARTQAPEIAALLAARAQPGDVVAFCPDQLAPAVLRLVAPAGVVTAGFPPGSPGPRVDWVDYVERVRSASPARFAATLDARAAGSTVWLAWSPGYHRMGRSCEGVLQSLRRLRPAAARAVVRDPSAYERASLWRFPPVVNP